MSNRKQIDFKAEFKVMKDLKNEISSEYINFQTSPKDKITESYIFTQLEALEENLSKLRLRHETIISYFDTKILEENGYLQDDVFYEGYEEYLDFKTDLRTALKELPISNVRDSSATIELESKPISSVSNPKFFTAVSTASKTNICKLSQCLSSSTKSHINHHHTLLHSTSPGGALAGNISESTRSENEEPDASSVTHETISDISANFLTGDVPCRTSLSTVLTKAVSRNEQPHGLRALIYQGSQESFIPKPAPFLTGDVSCQTSLSSALIKTESGNGQSHRLRALIDHGSQGSFISESVVQCLQLSNIDVKSTIYELDGGKSGSTSKHVMPNIQSLCAPDIKLQIKAHVINNITSTFPERKCILTERSDLNKILLADPQYNQLNKIDVLLGAEVYGRITEDGLVKSSSNSTIAQDSYPGWIISSMVGGNRGYSPQHNMVHNAVIQIEEHASEPVLTMQNQACEENFEATTCRDAEGRCIVELPFHCADPPCKYTNSILKKYTFLEHMEKISEDTEKEKTDAVHLSYHATSITKMERTIGVTNKHTDFQILWRTTPISLLTLTVDTVGAPYLAVNSLQQSAVDECTYPLAAEMGKSVSYVNDLTVTFVTASTPRLTVNSLQQTAVDECLYPLAAEREKADICVVDFMTDGHSETETVSRLSNGFSDAFYVANRMTKICRLYLEQGSHFQLAVCTFRGISASAILGNLLRLQEPEWLHIETINCFKSYQPTAFDDTGWFSGFLSLGCFVRAETQG